eukprot:5692864-Karenia_brevis.AAC.1
MQQQMTQQGVQIQFNENLMRGAGASSSAGNGSSSSVAGPVRRGSSNVTMVQGMIDAAAKM